MICHKAVVTRPRRTSRIDSWTFIAILGVLAALSPPLLAAPSDAGLHHEALMQARAGQHEDALGILASLVKRHPGEAPYLYDYVTVLGWAERDAEALSHLDAIDLETAPVYVLEALAKSARNLKRFPLSIRIYRAAAHRFPERIQSALGLAMSLADQGNGEEAAAVAGRMLQRHPGRSDILNTLAYVQLQQKNYFQALATYERVLASDPENRTAMRGRILITARLGAPHLAADMAARTPGMLTAEELDAIQRDRTAMAIRWGRLPDREDAPASRDSERAIASLRARLARVPGDGPPVRAKLQYDLMEALYDQQRHGEVITTFEELDSPAQALPDRVLTTAAGAYLQLKAPDKSLPLLQIVRQRNPENFDAALMLVYTHVDNENFDEARALANSLSEQEPPWRGGQEGTPLQPNPHKLEADVTAALVEAFAGDLEEAQARLETLLSNAPNNAELRSELAHINLWRGLPETALRESRIARALRPGLLNARLAEAVARLELYDFRNSHVLLREAEQRHPRAPGVKRLRRTWTVHNMRELYLTSGYGKSTGVQEGSEDFNIDAWLYSQPLKYRYRPFLYTHFATARFPEGDARYGRVGVGLEYRERRYRLVSTLTRDDDDSNVNAGLALSGLWKLTDHWHLGAGYDSNSNDIPLRGRLNEQVEGWSGKVDLTYYFHESRRIDTGLQYLDFNDGNIRNNASAVLSQRLFTRPHYRLDGSLGAYASSNTRDAAPYFNPARDLNLDISLVNEWLQFRRYERAFRHRLGFSLGSYYQKGFGTKGVGGLFYEQQWNPDDTFEISYGVSRARKAYDGAMENQTRLYLTLDWRF